MGSRLLIIWLGLHLGCPIITGLYLGQILSCFELSGIKTRQDRLLWGSHSITTCASITK